MPLVEVTRKFEKMRWLGSRLVMRPGSVWARSRRRAISSASEVRQSWEGGTLLFESSMALIPADRWDDIYSKGKCVANIFLQKVVMRQSRRNLGERIDDRKTCHELHEFHGFF
ncbi:MAG: hypothetical protein DMG10_19345 [Acidobacteria bacterium]|nr:MAG: hypothetical protein DMG10_19345 [Acidobacteriota bacterium]